MNLTKIAPAILVGAITALAASTASAQTLGVNFGANGNNGTTNDQITSPAGIVSLPAASWLNVNGANGTNVATPEGPTVTWSAGGLWGQTSGNLAPDGDTQLGSGYLDAGIGLGTATVTFTGLTNGLYDVYVYARRNENSFDTNPGPSDYVINGTSLSVDTGNIDPTGGNWFQSTNQAAPGNLAEVLGTTVSGGTLTVTAAASGTNFRAPVDGIELVQSVPEPASFGMFAAGVVGFLGLRRRRTA